MHERLEFNSFIAKIWIKIRFWLIVLSIGMLIEKHLTKCVVKHRRVLQIRVSKKTF
jgi:hypothetical protein